VTLLPQNGEASRTAFTKRNESLTQFFGQLGDNRHLEGGLRDMDERKHAWRASWPLAGVALAFSSSLAFAQDPQASALAPKWTPWVEFGGYYGTDHATRGEAVLWAPLTQGPSALLFGEARGKQFEEDMREGNFALGYRQMMPGGWNLGIWGGYDIRRSAFGHTFHQLAAGIEALSDRWDFRANAYLPLKDGGHAGFSDIWSSSSSIVATSSEINMLTWVYRTVSDFYEVALWGLDAEIGTKLFSTPENMPGARHELRVYAGAFHFDHPDIEHSVTGPRLRAEWRVDNLIDSWSGSRLTFEGEYSHDRRRDNRFEVGARLRLPFGDAGVAPAHTLTAQERRMSEGLERDTDIVVDRKATETVYTVTSWWEEVEDVETGVLFERVATVDATGDLSTVSTNAGTNSLIIVDGAAGTLTGAHTVQGNQTILGGGGTLQVRGLISGNVVAFTAPGSTPTLSASLGETVVTVGGDNLHLAGFNVSGGLFGIWADSRSNTVLSRLNISGSSYDGVHITGSGGSTRIQDTTITGAGDDTIQIGATSHVLTVRNSELINSRYGIYITAANTVLEINDVLFGNIYYWALASGLPTYQETISINNSVFSGHFNNTLLIHYGVLSGTGNTAIGATYSSVCFTGFGWTGSIEIDGTTYTSSDC
jgi:hypothetical protein